jgi:hypothetical protein
MGMAPTGCRSRVARALASERGQASVELVAVLPFVLLTGLVAWQLLLAGHALWLCAAAARTAARAEAVGARTERAARSALPEALERHLEVATGAGGRVRVSVRVPFVVQRWSSPVWVSATSSLGGRD